MTAKTKPCSSCGITLPHTPEFFHVNNNKRCGLSSACKACVNAKHREKYAKNPEQRKQISARWREAHRDDYLAAQKRWRGKNRAGRIDALIKEKLGL